ncbi:MAG: thiol peroxidase [Fusobacteriaceae bacterium]|nr:thiol peroxidase [Fusobacteriaceae bacterium]
MNKRTNEVKFAGNYVTILGSALNIGDAAPNFTTLKNDLSLFSSSDLKGKIKIISVVPSVDTGVCALQTIRFNKEASNFDDVKIITISADLPFALSRFCGANGIENSITVSDHKDLDFGFKYGFVIEELRLLTRGIVVIDKNDVIRHIEYVSEITEHPNYDEALKIIKNI